MQFFLSLSACSCLPALFSCVIGCRGPPADVAPGYLPPGGSTWIIPYNKHKSAFSSLITYMFQRCFYCNNVTVFIKGAAAQRRSVEALAPLQEWRTWESLFSEALFSCLCLLAGTIKWHKLAQWWHSLPVKPVFLNFFEVFLLITIFGISSKNTPTKLWERQCSPQVNWPSDRPGFYWLWECSGGNGTSRLMGESVTLFQWRWTL